MQLGPSLVCVCVCALDHVDTIALYVMTTVCNHLVYISVTLDKTQ